MTDQWRRRVSLIVAPPQGDQGLDLSEMQIRFTVRQSDVETPNNAIIRIYNLSERTTATIEKEYTRVVLQAGYETGAFGVIFDGTIKQVRRGKVTATDSYLDILAADGDLAYNFAALSQSLAAGATLDEQYEAIAQAAKEQGVDTGYKAPIVGPVLPRGKVLFGMWRDYMRDWSTTAGVTWSVQDGKVIVLPLTGYRPGEAVVMNSRTGMIGIPEQTENGIRIRSLLNPRLRIGGLVQIDNASINRTIFKTAAPIPFDRYAGLQLLAPVTDDGFYRLYVVEHEGNTRGNEWYSDLICLAVDMTAAPDKAVKEFG